ncbi:MAG: C39 family peptidase [bacterium]|nr:C39 family peptidase [bacterium]
MIKIGIVSVIIIFIPCILFARGAAGSDERMHLLIVNEFNLRKHITSWIELRDRGLVRQAYDYSCGASSLSTILEYFFNEDINEKEILDVILKFKGIDNKKNLEDKDFRLSFHDFEEFARLKGYKAIGLALPVESLKQLKIPAIVFIKIRRREHFSMYKGMDEQFVYLADPSFGNIKVRMSKFREMFATRKDDKHPGKILVFIPLDKAKEEQINKEFLDIPKGSWFIYRVINMKMWR